MKTLNKIFNISKPVIGMIHIDALPGTPKYKGNVKSIIDKAIMEAKFYKSAGIDAIMIENMHDVPYLKREVGPEIVSAMSIICYEIKNQTNLPIGIQVLAGANKAAIAIALAAGLDFIRAEGFVFGHVADEGFIESDAGELMRFRKAINADKILVLTDIKKKHSSHSITEDVNLIETAEAAEFFLSDGVVITGTSTGKEVNLEDIKSLKGKIKIPVFIGSGITANNIEKYLPHCNGIIVGSYFKKSANWKNTVDTERVRAFMKIVNKLR